MAWFMIVAAGLFEVAMAYSLKLSDGFSSLPPSICFGVFAVASFGLLAFALKSLEVGTAYAVWTGIGRPVRPPAAPPEPEVIQVLTT
ncbi:MULTISPECIES: SMR family transporter [unclassified Nonomuraea]|uniref:DMT family transporter n=1 Tax=unclassified Nonomuraea TaxID=2593643 RepID=UPI0033EA534F